MAALKGVIIIQHLSRTVTSIFVLATPINILSASHPEDREFEPQHQHTEKLSVQQKVPLQSVVYEQVDFFNIQ